LAKIHGSYDRIVVQAEQHGQPHPRRKKLTPAWIEAIFQRKEVKMVKVKDSELMPVELIEQVNLEISRGIAKWGDVDKDPPTLLIAITEELGEVAHAINHHSGREKIQQEIAETIGILVRLYDCVKRLIEWARRLFRKPLEELPSHETPAMPKIPWAAPAYPNMPKYQPCPICDRGSKRESKTLGGARYDCSIHGIFFVRKA